MFSTITVKITGKNINNFIKRIANKKINMFKIKIISSDCAYIDIKNKDFNQINKIKTVYKLELVETHGFSKIFKRIKKNKVFILLTLLFLNFIYFFSNIIFEVEVITNDSRLKKELVNELKTYGIEKYRFKKNYIEIEKIKKKILKNHKNNIDWIEIENIGIKYIIKLEKRVINNKLENSSHSRNIVAKKDAVLYRINASKGQIVKNVNTYIKKGDIIVSGSIYVGDNLKTNVVADAKIYGEVWYEAIIKYPYLKYLKKKTGKAKKTFVLEIFKKKIVINKNNYNNYISDKKYIIKDKFFPLKIYIENNYEYNKIAKINKNIDKEILNYFLKNVKNKLKNDEFIKYYKIKNSYIEDNKKVFKIFYSVVEDITDYSYIE